MIQQRPLRTDVHKELQGLILRGELSPGQRISDTELAARMGVSRTPIREALLRMEREGFVLSQQNQGFFVKPLSESEIRDVYPLVGMLECSALHTLPPIVPEKIGRLNQISQTMAKEVDRPLRRIELDDQWHRALISDNGNQHLTRILEELKRVILRYEYAFMQVSEWVTVSLGEHDTIIASLQDGDRHQAAKVLGDHWDRSMKSVLSKFFVQETYP
jgi:DNA-binding GntR family transcriptional regulator